MSSVRADLEQKLRAIMVETCPPEARFDQLSNEERSDVPTMKPDAIINAQRCKAFHAMHRAGLLLLPNVWDAGSARLAYAGGAHAVATSSAALAWSHGRADGETLPIADLLRSVQAIVAAVELPVSVDIEAGYSDDPTQVGELVGVLSDLGVAGINIEDGTASVDLLCAKIQAARRAASQRGVNLFINARTDLFLRALVPADRRLSEALSRGARYRAAGADGWFVPGATARRELRTLVDGVALPLNVMARCGLPPLPELQALGVRRLSAGSGIAEAVQAVALAMMRTFAACGEVSLACAAPLTYSEVNALMARG